MQIQWIRDLNSELNGVLHFHMCTAVSEGVHLSSEAHSESAGTGVQSPPPLFSRKSMSRFSQLA